jgi:YVTN family beta-propeller protein
MVIAAACIALAGVGVSGAAAAPTYAVTATINVGFNPDGVAVDQATNTTYVTNILGTNTVSVINGATNTVTATINVGSAPYGVAVDQATNTAYVTNLVSNTVSVLDLATNTVTATINVGSTSTSAVPRTGWRWTRPPTPPT